MKKFIPDDFKVPDTCKTRSYIFRKFKKKDNVKDYQAVMKNADFIKKIRGGKLCHDDWPASDFSLEDNRKDVTSFLNNFKQRKSFAYIIWDKNESKYLGCIYLNPIEKFYIEYQDKYDVDFSMWVTKDVYKRGLYTDIYQVVYDWLREDWPFKRIMHRNAEVPIDV